MLRIGRYNTLPILRETRHGLVLGRDGDEVLLPFGQAEERLPPVGERLRVFVYTDSEDRPIATLRKPHATVGEIAYLECVDLSEHGAFLDWGLDKDLFAPFGEQHARLRVGRHYVVAVALHERTGRVFGASKLARYFDYDVEDVQAGDEVDLLVYHLNEHGAQVVVDGRHAGLVYEAESHRPLRIGDELRGFVKQVRHDNKLDIQLQRQGKQGRDDAQQAILDALEDGDGFLGLHDGSSPEDISRELDMSKKAFKRAVGGLYKARRIELLDDGIRLLDED